MSSKKSPEENSDSSQKLTKARNSAFQFLKTRNRSEKEIRDRLAKKKYSKDTIETTIQYLTKLNLIDDRQFAKNWISLRMNKPLGARRIFSELLEKGIAKTTIDEELKIATAEAPVEERLKTLAEKRMGRYSKLDPLKAKKRLFDFLLRKGFDFPTVKKVIEQL